LHVRSDDVEWHAAKEARMDRDDDPQVLNNELRDAIEKQLRRTDLSPEDRKEYEDALAKLDKED
jgi:hypothetical protein